MAGVIHPGTLLNSGIQAWWKDPEPELDHSEVKKDWNSRGFSFGLWTDPPGQVWSDFVHDVDELVMLVDGEIELSFHSRTFRPKPGEEILIPARASHTVKNVGGTTSRWFYGYRRDV